MVASMEIFKMRFPFREFWTVTLRQALLATTILRRPIRHQARVVAKGDLPRRFESDA